MNKYTENETKQPGQSNRDFMAWTLELVCSVIQAKGKDFVLNNKCVQEMLSTVYAQCVKFGNIVCGSKNPAVSIEESVSPDYIVCLEDGVRVKMLKKYLRRKHNMSPEEYMRKWDLPSDYPLVAPSYSKQRRDLAVKAKLGHMRSSKSADAKKVKVS